MKTACVGDSITEGWGLESGWPEILGEDFVNCGWRGTGAQSAFHPWLESIGRMKYDQIPGGPQRTLVLLGSNDALEWTPHFAPDYEALCASFPHPVLITPPRFAQPYPPLEKVRQAILAAGKKHGWPVLDLYEKSGPDWLGGDGIHPTMAGQQAIARQVRQFLEDYDD